MRPSSTRSRPSAPRRARRARRSRRRSGCSGTCPSGLSGNEIAQTAALGHHSDRSQRARTFAALNLTLADSTIALYDAKYAYGFWRPITAIHAADSDDNPGTVADPAWTPLSPTAPDPSYPGAHATISAAAANVLRGL